MTKSTQAQKNIDLSQELAEYIADNPKSVENLPENSSFIIFSSEDESLNIENEGLIKSIIAEGKKVIKAIQTKDKENPWKFSQVAY
ncbi:MAG TPA: DUF5647 family protein [Patescibacteria group bacterium]|nr:DUF5647 family protein [Patescibacteria group bacterium]